MTLLSKEAEKSKKNHTQGNSTGHPEDKQSKFVALGKKLRKLREAQSISISAVSDHTKIQKHFIEFIEEGALNNLPKGPYLRGFLRQYCSYLSADDLWKSYDVLTEEQKIQFVSPNKKLGQVEYASKPKVFKPKPLALIYTVIFLSLLAALFVTWQLRPNMPITAKTPIDGGNVFTVMSQDMSEISADLIIPTNETSVDLGWMDNDVENMTVAPISPDIEQKSPAISELNNELKIIPSAVVWIRVSRNEKVLFQGLIKPGEEKTFTVEEGIPLRLKSGKPKETGLVWKDKSIDSMGDFRVPVVRYYWPDGEITETDKR